MKLKRFELIAGGKFTGTNGPVMFDFSEAEIIGIRADEKKGKSTIIKTVLLNTGMIGGEKVINDLINTETGELKSNLYFEVGKSSYEVNQNMGVLKVRKEGEVQPGGPQTLLKQLLGLVGVSPMGIKDAPIEDIVKWLANYSTKGAEGFAKEMLKIKDGIRAAKKSRADANKSAKGLKEFMVGEGYVDERGDLIELKWVESEKKYAAPVDIKSLSAKLTTIGNKSDKFIENESKVAAQDARKTQIEAQIAALQKELRQVNENIEVGKKWLQTNENVKKEYDRVKKEYDAAATNAVAYEKWQDIKKKKGEMDSFEDLAMECDASEKRLIKKQQELQWEVIPDIQGVELVLEDTHEDEGEQKKAGYYYKGLNSRQLSASEWLEQVIKILKKNGIQFLVLDDVSQFGSEFISTLKKLAKSGCYVLYAEMLRGQEEIVLDYSLNGV